ncbi:MAG: LacI family DNA-binding transcriptional regulator [Chthonomonadales bacterium]
MAVTLKHLAQQLGVSVSTVSRVLSGNRQAMVSEATARRVRQLAEELGYQPNRSARALVTGRSCTVALWMNDLYASFHAQVAHLVYTRLHSEGYEVLVRCMEQMPQALRTGHGHIDGIVAHDCAGALAVYLRQRARRWTPVVSMGGYVVRHVDHVAVDLYAGAFAAVVHLHSIGCRRIAYLVNAESRQQGDARRDGYDAAARELQFATEYIIAVDQWRSSAREAIRTYAATRGLPDGLFCHNDEMAIGAYRGLCDLGVRVPTDVAIVGCDGIEDTEYLEVPITTVIQPLDEMCDSAWSLLKRRMAAPDAAVEGVVLQPILAIRASTQR